MWGRPHSGSRPGLARAGGRQLPLPGAGRDPHIRQPLASRTGKSEERLLRRLG